MNNSPQNDSSQLPQLQSRPSIEESVARYKQMQIEIRDRLSAEIGPWQWRSDNYHGEAGCSDFPNTAGESRNIPGWEFDGAIPEDKWEHAQRIVQEITGNYGFGDPVILSSRPGTHQFTVDDQYGARVRFGSAKVTLISTSTGCHLPQAEKDKTSPKPQGQATPDAIGSSTPQATEPVPSTPDFGPFDPARFSSRRHG